MTISTTRFGDIEVSDDLLIQVPAGLLGFESIHTFCLLPHAPDSPFNWLQAIDDPELAFVVVNPFDFFPEYDFEIADADVPHIGTEDPAELVVFSIITFADKRLTANLVGPVVMNVQTQVARQIVLSDPRYGTRHELIPAFAQTAAVA
ncbi:MAG: flagellar assembly protein FliW [Armatimonadota bacterium]